MDPKEFENKYFIDAHRYNCAFCHVRSIGFIVVENIPFDWANEKSAYAYFIKCLGWGKVSLHLSYLLFPYDDNDPENVFANPPTRRTYADGFPLIRYLSPKGELKENKDFYHNGEILDEYFFYHHPFSPFSVDTEVPQGIRSLIDEADGCRRQNFLVGASRALRKAIYEFLLDQNINGVNYEEKIKTLKSKYPKAQEEIFDALAGIQDLTSNALHEDALGNWEPWKIKDFNYVLQVIKAAMYEVYTSPKRSKDWLIKINAIKNKPKKHKLI
ncbi:MAG: hypothetical protein AAB929_06155 [Patescibacteria group bacterium]